MKTIAKAAVLLLLAGLFAVPTLATTVVMQSGCDVFQEPDAASAVVGHVSANQELLYIGGWTVDERGARWYEVEYDAFPGWVPARYGALNSEASEYLSRLPSDYIGAWKSLEGGADYSEYYLNVYDFVDGETFLVDFEIYRMWGFDYSMAVIEGNDYATLVTEDDQYQVIGKLDFMKDRLALTVLFSDYPYLDADKYIVFERAEY